MLVVNRFVVGGPDGDAESAAAVTAFTARAHAALAALAACPGYRAGRLCRAFDEPSHWCLVTEWESVGAYRRALSTYDVRVAGTPLLGESLPEPSAFEVLASTDAAGAVVVTASDRASGDASSGPLRSRA